MYRTCRKDAYHAVKVVILSAAVVFVFSGSAIACEGAGVHNQSSSGSEGAIPGAAYAQEHTKGGPQTLCPITGEKIDRSVYLDYQGKRVYFCCAACKSAFLQDPSKHLQQMESKGIAPEKTPQGQGIPPGAEAGQSGQEPHSSQGGHMH